MLAWAAMGSCNTVKRFEIDPSVFSFVASFVVSSMAMPDNCCMFFASIALPPTGEAPVPE